MAKIKPGDTARLNYRELFSDWARRDATVSIVTTERGFPTVSLEDYPGEFIQGGEDWQQSNAWRDRWYRMPPKIGGPYFTRS